MNDLFPIIAHSVSQSNAQSNRNSLMKSPNIKCSIPKGAHTSANVLSSTEKHISNVLQQTRASHKDKSIQDIINELYIANYELDQQIIKLQTKNKSMPRISDKIYTIKEGAEIQCIIPHDSSKYYKMPSKLKYGPLKVRNILIRCALK